MSKTMILKPRLSEKAYNLSENAKSKVYVFEVPAEANKHMIAAAVTAQFDVTVTAVNLMNTNGKAKRTVRRGGRATSGVRSDVRKAYVSVKAGDSIALFPKEEAEDTKASKPAAKRSKEKK